MNDYLLSFILGIIEGLTEFLPVSSTAHLRISEALLGIDLQDGYWKMFSIVIQLGAILCLPIIFPQPDRRVSLDLSQRHSRRPHRSDAPTDPDLCWPSLARRSCRFSR